MPKIFLLVSKTTKILFICFLSYFDEKISHLLRYFAYYYFEGNKIFDKYVQKKIDYFTLTVCLFSWLVVDYYKYLPPNFMDHTWNTVMTKTRNIAFSKAILILVNKRNTPGISYNICSFRLYAVRFFSYGQ